MILFATEPVPYWNAFMLLNEELIYSTVQYVLYYKYEYGQCSILMVP